MKPLDLKSTLFAGVFGAALAVVVVYLYNRKQRSADGCGCGAGANANLWGAAGFVVGAGVQTLVRLTGVS